MTMRLFYYLIFLHFYTFATTLDVDPTFVRGKLPNGMNYFIKSNKTPPNKTELWLRIDSGSLDEEEHQRGGAHYLEHLAFNGSKNFPAGSLVKYFESLGLKFGSHQNAFTSFDETVYTLSLPKSDLETIDKGLLCLSDYAYRLDLDEKEVEKERSIILEEKRVRSGAGRRFWNAYLKELFPNSRVANRFPIGTEESLKALKQKDLKDFYQKWYRPYNATVMIIGDFEPSEVEKLVNKHFSNWEKGEKVAHLKGLITPNDKRKIAIIDDKEFEKTSFLLSNSFLKSPSHTDEYYNDLFKESVINYIISLHFQKYLQEEKISFEAGKLCL